MSKKTAIEWLINELDYETISKFDKKLLQAKEMEKEQIVDAYEIGFADAWDDARYDDEPKHAGAEQYYNETFNKSIKDKG